ncbi:MAG TPA: oxygenase MpaB family protein, partial [Polyangiaceae bacterium]|nr:oxygenase MpaB family protein [Polyangiaceae bacterium]
MGEAPRRFVHTEEATRRFGRAAVDRLGALFGKGDPLADALVLAFEKLPPGSGTRMLEQALRGGIESVSDAPPELRALFAELDHVPYWVDDAAIERGGELLFRAGWFGGLALGASLLYGYGSPGGNKPLVFSGRLEQQTPRRLIETSRFVEATCVPGGLRRFGEGFAATVHVRYMHAKVRRLLLTSGRWSTDDWGLPANQHDMGATSLLFSAVVIDSLEKLGFELEPDEVHLYMQLWRYSGYLMGVDPEILPTSEREARRLMDFIATTEGEPDDDSRKLAHAYFSAGDNPLRATEEEKARARRIVRVHQGITRGVLGAELADQLGVPKHRLRHLYPVVKATVRGMEATRRALPGPAKSALHAAAVRQGRAFWAMLTRGALSPITFAPPDALLGA